jgi:sensor histidine kinase YesM
VDKLPIKQLVKTAFITAPLIAVIYCTPFYIFKVIPNLSIFLILPIFTMPMLIAWFTNIALLVFVRAPWVRTYLRTILVILFMFGLSEIVTRLFNPFVTLDGTSVLIVRIVNVVSVNSIIYVLIDLTITKENKNMIELENANLKIVKLEAEYKLLKDQINPHFLFNALSTAKALIKSQPALAEEYIIRLSDFLRASIKNSKKTISLKEELQLCSDFVSLNKIRFGNALNIEYGVAIDQTTNFVPYFALLSLIENAIKHNTFTTESPLHISLIAQDDMIEVKNNKKIKFVLEEATKTGLMNLNERYKLLGGKEIIITDNENYYSVKIPILKN